MGARIEVRAGAHDLGRIAREQVGQHRLALDDAGIAETRLPRRLAQSIDDRDRSPPLLKRERGGDADDAGPQNDGIDASDGRANSQLPRSWSTEDAVAECVYNIASAPQPVPIDPARRRTRL